MNAVLGSAWEFRADYEGLGSPYSGLCRQGRQIALSGLDESRATAESTRGNATELGRHIGVGGSDGSRSPLCPRDPSVGWLDLHRQPSQLILTATGSPAALRALAGLLAFSRPIVEAV